MHKFSLAFRPSQWRENNGEIFVINIRITSVVAFVGHDDFNIFHRSFEKLLRAIHYPSILKSHRDFKS